MMKVNTVSTSASAAAPAYPQLQKPEEVKRAVYPYVRSKGKLRNTRTRMRVKTIPTYRGYSVRANAPAR